MNWRTCLCECHSVIPVSIYDRVAAASACSQCHDSHVQRYVKRPARVKPPAADTSTAWNHNDVEPE